MRDRKGAPAPDQIVTANRLSDGVVVFFAPDGGWSERIASARIVAKAEGAALLAEAEAAAAEAVAPYLIDIDLDVECGGAQPVPRRYRERIRAFGPSIHPQFAKHQFAKPDFAK